MADPGARPLRHVVLAAALWLPAMFFVWVAWSSVFSLPATSLARTMVERGFPGLFQASYLGFPRALMGVDAALPELPGTPHEGATARDDHIVVLRFAEEAMPPAMLAEKRQTGAEPLVPVNSMIYGYGLAVIWGLVMATPLTVRRRLLQMAAGWGLIVLVQAFGVVTAALVNALQFLGGDTLRAQGLNPEVVAALYQFGYLILPAVAPVVLWIVMNRPFIQTLVAQAEPAPATAVPEAMSGAPGRAQDETGKS